MTARLACVAVILVLATSCKDERKNVKGANDAITAPVADVLGPGWNCYAAPSAFKAVGRIFSVDVAGVTSQEGGVDVTPVSATIAFGEFNIAEGKAFKGVFSLLEEAIPGLTANAGFEHTDKRSTSLSFTKPLTQEVGETAVARQAKQWYADNAKDIAPGSQVFYIKEVIRAGGINYKFTNEQIAALGGEATLKGIATLKLSPLTKTDPSTSTPPISSPPAAGGAAPGGPVTPPSPPAYQLIQTFDEPLGVCIMAAQLYPTTAGFQGNKDLVAERPFDRSLIDFKVTK